MNKLSQRLAERRRSGKPILDLTESNPTRCGFHYDEQALLAPLAQPSALAYDPQPKGHWAARQAIAGYYAERKIPLDPEQVVLTAGTSEAYSFLFRLLANPGDSVLAPRPSYPLFDFLATLNDVRLQFYPLIYDRGWHIDWPALRAAIDARTRAILLVNPNNPTGSFLRREDLEALAEIGRREELAVISDEVFGDYAWAADPRRVETLAGACDGLTFSLNGISKMMGLPQMKLGWIAAAGPEGRRQEALERLEVIADTYLSVSTPAQLALPAWLAGRQAIQQEILGRVQNNQQYLLDQVSRAATCEYLEAEGGWYAILQAPHLSNEEEWILDLLDREGVLAHPGYFFDFAQEGFLVLSLLPPPDIFQPAIRRLLTRLEDLRGESPYPR